MAKAKTYSLLQVMTSIRTALEQYYKGQYWVMSEMNRLNHYQHSGHCYPELVEKTGTRVVAQARSIIWKNDFERINMKFLEVLKEPLRDGIKILFLCKVSFDPIHGLSLRILDIDPSYTLGDLEREKAESIGKLKEGGSFDLNRLTQLPLIPSRIAVISVESSKGYADFNGILDNNPEGFKINRSLFPSILQGDAAVHSILFQLKTINKAREKFDAVVIIRGGGGDIGLSCYNNYMLAKSVAEFPLPVITGIGHATNETVVELVAHTNCITPTKVAEFILEKYRVFSKGINDLSLALANLVKRRFKEENQLLFTEQKLLKINAAAVLLERRNNLTMLRSDIYHASNYSIAYSRNLFIALRTSLARQPLVHLSGEGKEVIILMDKLRSISNSMLSQHERLLLEEQRNVSNLHPDKVLQRGYAVIMQEGKIVTGTTSLKKGDTVETIMKDGAFNSEVDSFNNKPGIFRSES